MWFTFLFFDHEIQAQDKQLQPPPPQKKNQFNRGWFNYSDMQLDSSMLEQHRQIQLRFNVNEQFKQIPTQLKSTFAIDICFWNNETSSQQQQQQQQQQIFQISLSYQIVSNSTLVFCFKIEK